MTPARPLTINDYNLAKPHREGFAIESTTPVVVHALAAFVGAYLVVWAALSILGAT